METEQRLALLRQPALEASREHQVFKHVTPLLYLIWADCDASTDEPIPVRCALAEREILRLVPLGMSPGELLAGRLDPSSPMPEIPGASSYWEVRWWEQLPPDMCGSGTRGHTALDAEKLLKLGIKGIEAEINQRIGTAVSEDACTFYRSALISLEGLKDLVARLQQMAANLAHSVGEKQYVTEMARLAEMLKRVPYRPAETFYEALQAVHLLYFAASLTVQAVYGPGRIDRILYSYYEADLHDGRITREEALQLICSQFLLVNYAFNIPQPVIVGGMGPDGHDTTNEITYLCLEADYLVGLQNPSLAVGINEETPYDLLDKAAQSILAGRTKPSLFNDRVIIEGLSRLGVPYNDAIDYIHSTCAEITLIGKSNIWVSSPFINLLKPLEFMLNGGRQMQEGAPSDPNNEINSYTRLDVPALASYGGFDDFLREYKRQLAGKIEDAAALTRELQHRRTEGWAFPLVSCFTSDCLERGVDVDRGGARYTWAETCCVGLANIVDSLMVIECRAFKEGSPSLEEIRNMLLANFPDEAARLNLIRDVPCYGNDEPEADSLLNDLMRRIYDEHYKQRDYLGGWFVPGLFAWMNYRFMGESTAASPDGRRAGDVLVNDSGPAQGRGRCGPTAIIRSVTSWEHAPALGGIVLNLRFSPQMFADEPSRAKLVDLIRTYIALGGFEVQFNAVNNEILRAAQREPEKYSDLIVRISGFSDYFTLLDSVMQEEIIGRIELGV